MFELDHIAVAGETLAAAVAHSETALGQPIGPGGQHTHFATHNQLLGLAEGLYFEAIAVDPSQPDPGHARWFGLDHFSGPARLDKWILRCTDITAAAEVFPEIGRPVHLTRGAVSWTMLVPEDGILPYDGLFPAFIEWHVPEPPGKSLPATGLRLETLHVGHPRAAEMAARLAPYFTDNRVRFDTQPDPSLKAVFDGDDGRRILA